MDSDEKALLERIAIAAERVADAVERSSPPAEPAAAASDSTAS